MGVSGVGVDGMLTWLHRQLATGKKINAASDGASELAISEKIKAASVGLDTTTANYKDGQNLINSADGALGGISESLQRMRELAQRASSPIMSSSDKEMIQSEIDQLKSGINQMAKGTNFNGIKTLEGSYLNLDSSNGNFGVATYDATLENMGIAGFDVRGDFDISAIDDAMSAVSRARGEFGAASNALDYSMAANEITSINLQQANSNLVDADMARGVMELMQARVLKQANIFGIQQKQKTMQNNNLSMLGIV